MLRSRQIVVLLSIATLHAPVHGQIEPHAHMAANIVVPQARAYAAGQRSPVEITGVSVGVVISDQVAVTMLEIRVRNPARGRQEAELLVPVPDGAAVRGFSFAGSAAEPSARLLPRDEARQAYERIVAQSRDPALLEFAGYNLVRSSVFPVEPGRTQAVRLTYEHILPSDGERVDYVLPRSESIEYKVPWKIAVKIGSSRPIAAIYSPSHPLKTISRGSRSASLELSSEATGDPGPFRLSILRESGGFSASLFAYPDPKIGGGYFLLLAGPPALDKPARPTLRRDVTLVIDHSGSMRGEKLDQVREAALEVLGALEDGEAFNIILYNEFVDVFSARPVLKSRATVKDAETFLNGMAALGGTNIHDALLEALRPAPAEGMLPIVLFLTDGLPTIGQTSESAIRDLARKGNPRGKRIFTFGVGVDVNTPLLEKIAYESRATTTFVLPGENVEVKVAGVFRRLSGPVLANPVLRAGPVCRALPRVREVIPARLPDVFEGDRILVLGQYLGEAPLDFTLDGNYRGEPKTFSLSLSLDHATTRNAFVPRLWATRKIGLLIDAVREAGAAPAAVSAGPNRELVDEIVRLSTEFGALTEYTAFLAREGNEFSMKDKIVREAGRVLQERAEGVRFGLGSVNQDLNNQGQKIAAVANPRNKYKDATMNDASIASVQQVSDLSFFKRGNRWIDGRLVAQEKEPPAERVIEFGSEEFRALVARLANEGRQGSIALRGDILMLIDGKPVLVKAPVDHP